MAKVKVTIDKRKLDRFKKEAAKKVTKTLPKMIVKEIERGISPVKGEGRFQRYSDSYREQIREGRFQGKSKSPVNLKLSGKLLDSVFAKIVGKSVIVGFDNFLADIHNRLGAGKSKVVRRMLPTNKGEKFNPSISLDLTEQLKSIAKNIFR